jgi:E3 ubiquitin-protein ligase DOA10
MVLVQCKICLEEYPAREIEAEDLISPCACKESVKYVHRKCLTRWHQEAGVVRDRCTICNTKFEYIDKGLHKRVLLCLVLSGVYFVVMMVLIYYKRVSDTVGFLNPVEGASCLQYVVLLFTDILAVLGFLFTLFLYGVSLGTIRGLFLSDIKDTPDIPDVYGQIHYKASEKYFMCVSHGIALILAVLRICADLERRGVVIELKRNREIKDLNKT